MNPKTINLDTMSFFSKKRLAMNPKTSSELLTLLTTNKDWEIRWQVSFNPNTPSNVLEILAKDVDKEVRYGVAEHQKRD